MPNGGSDCCATCWFNRRNRGKAGRGNADPAIADACEIRDLAIESASYTYCANHPHHMRERVPIPIGPVRVDEGRGRVLWRHSPDSPRIRDHLLALLARTPEVPPPEYPIGQGLEEAVVWQLGEFAEPRAIPDLKRILAFSPQARGPDPFARTREGLIAQARSALDKISKRA
jgi:hypothetical protein